MSIASNQLGAIYNQIREKFIGSPIVTITPIQGDPPDKYRVTYNIPGKSHDPSGDIIETHEHVIEISIPFGFPHFPPNCKPVTDIFHPDFDPGAVFIGDYWHQDSDLIDLIRHIGEMINGQHYSREDAFNSEAAEWYEAHRDHFPITALSWKNGPSQVAERDDSSDLTLELEEAEEAVELTLDLDDDDDVRIDIDESDDSPIAFLSFSSEEEDGSGDRLEILTTMKKSREFMRLKRELDGQEGFSEEFRNLHTQAIRILEDVEKKYAEAKQKEESEHYKAALTLYKEVYDKVSDYPAIQSDILRLEQTVSFMDDIGMGESGEEKSEPMLAPPEKPSQPASHSKKGKKPFLSAPPPVQKIQINTPNITPIIPMWRKLLYGALVLIFLVSLFFGIHLYAENNITRAQLFHQNCVKAMEAGAYQDTFKYCSESLEAAQQSYLFFGSEKEKLITENSRILNSETLKNGLAGKVMIDGQQYSVEEAKIIFLIQKKKSAADDAYMGKRFSEAVGNYESVLKLAEKSAYLNNSAIEEIQNRYDNSLMQQGLQLIENNKSQQNWQGMLTAINEAKVQLDNIPQEDRASMVTLLQLYTTEAELGQITAQANNALSQEQWDRAIEWYQQAERLASQHPNMQKSEIVAIQNQLARATLYKTLENANNAFSKGRWDTAIAAYSDATELINNPHYALLDKEQSEQNNNRLKKIILKASIVKEQESIQSLLDNSELKNAKNTYRKLLDLIDNSSLAGEPEFAKLKKEIKNKIGELDHLLYLGNKRQYLEKNYKRLFTRFYTNVKESNLSSPKVTLISENGSELLFRMECKERKPGARPLTLVMKYRYNKKSDRWSLVTD